MPTFKAQVITQEGDKTGSINQIFEADSLEEAPGAFERQFLKDGWFYLPSGSSIRVVNSAHVIRYTILSRRTGGARNL